MVNSMKIVVTGASGFIAKNLRKYLSEKNIELISISRNDFKNFKCETKIISKNYEENDILKKIQNSDALIHLVGIGKQSVYTDYDVINTNLTKHIVHLSNKSKIKKIIFLSGLGVSPNTSLGYFISKFNAEKQPPSAIGPPGVHPMGCLLINVSLYWYSGIVTGIFSNGASFSVVAHVGKPELIVQVPSSIHPYIPYFLASMVKVSISE